MTTHDGFMTLRYRGRVSAAARILVVDDEKVLRELIRPYLEAEGYEVLEARNGPEALEIAQRERLDLVLLDVMLPGEDGFAVLRQLRRISTIPVLMLTARRDEENRVAGLRQGADDYVVKPFSSPELVARVAAHLRRARGTSPHDSLRVGQVVVNVASRTVHAEGQEVELTRREFDLLVEFMQSPGKVLSRDALLGSVWDGEDVTSKTVDVHVALLRRKLGESLVFTSLRGVGYRLEPA